MKAEATALASEIVAARRHLRRLEPFATRRPGFSIADAYAVAAELERLRVSGGETPIGRKIGFTNRNIWPEYGVYAPIWGAVYDSTLVHVAPKATVSIGHLSQPRIEPEIVVGIDRNLGPDATLNDAEAAIAWVAHGFEIVQTVFDGWKFAAPDCTAEGALHGLLCVGPRIDITPSDRFGLAKRLAGLKIELRCNGALMDSGVGANVLDGPVHALAFAAREIAREPSCQPLRAGEMVTTGTMTRAFPIAPGERWSTVISEFDLPGLDVSFA